MLIIVVVIILLAISGGAYYYFFANTTSPKPVETEPVIASEEEVLTLNPEDIGLEFTARADEKAVTFVLTKISEIDSVEYEIMYLAKGDIPRGAIGNVSPKPGASEIRSGTIDLGTCSSGKCKYDEGVKSVDLILKITKNNGKVYQVKDTLEL